MKKEIEEAVQALKTALTAEDSDRWSNEVRMARLALDVALLQEALDEASSKQTCGTLDPDDGRPCGLPPHAFGIAHRHEEDVP